MKTATHNQIKDIVIRLLNLPLGGVDGAAIQRGTEGYSIENINRRIIAFLNNGLDPTIEIPEPLIIDRSKPFDVRKFMGREDVTIWRGPMNGNGLKGEEEQDSRSLSLTKMDFTKVLFMSCLKEDEKTISGFEKFSRLLNTKHIRLDAKACEALFEEKDHATLQWAYRVLGITELQFPGTVVRASDGSAFCLDLWRMDESRDGRGKWCSGHSSFRDDQRAEQLFAVLVA